MTENKEAREEGVMLDELAAEMLGAGSYKIHNVGTSNGKYSQAPTGRFYSSYPAALRAAAQCFMKGGPNNFSDGHPCEGIVIYKAIRVIIPKVNMPDNVEIVPIILEP